MARPEFVEARFHTSYLDELLQQRAGEPFSELDPSLEEVAAIAACLVEASLPAFAGAGAPSGLISGGSSPDRHPRSATSPERTLEGSSTERESSLVRFEVETGRRRRTIEVRRSGDGWAVTIDGRVRWVDFAPTGDRWSMLLQPVDSDAGSRATESMRRRGASYEIAIERQGQGKHIVHVDGHAVPLTVLTPGQGRSGVGSAPATRPGRLRLSRRCPVEW